MSDANKELLSQIFEMVETKKAEKKPRKKRVLTPEQREKAIANLKKGRETSLRNRQAKAKAKSAPQPERAITRRGRPPPTTAI